jgi:hypothetical protein
VVASPPASPRLAWPAIAAAAALLLIVLAALGHGLRLTGGTLVYTVDDPYIHMTIARNVAVHGSWGINPGRFEPASSSPLWTLLQAGIDRLIGSHAVTPLVLGLLCAVLAVFVIERMLRPYVAGGLVRAGIVLAIALAIPLPAAISTGMEAPLHVLLALLLVARVARHLTASGREPRPGDDASGRGSPLAAGALALLCQIVRPDSIFLIGVLALVAHRRRQPATAWALAVGGAMGLAGLAGFTLSQGGLWLPNPVLVKAPTSEVAGPGDLGQFLIRIPHKLIWKRHSHMTAPLLAAGWMLLPRPRIPAERADAPRLLLATFVPAALLHVQFADLGWFYRYEAYLVAFGLTAIVAGVARGLFTLPAPFPARRLPVAARAVAVLMTLALATPVVTRTVRSARQIGPAMRDIHDQQFQMARFVRAHLAGRTIAINDLGAIGYYGSARIVDLLGLASTPVARETITHRLDTDFIGRYCAEQGVEVGILYESFFEGQSRLPASWRRVATWTTSHQVTVADTVVTFFATPAGSVDQLRAALQAFAPELPSRVRVDWLEGAPSGPGPETR